MSPVRVLHIITRLIVGGAQENTMLTADLLDRSAWNVEVLSGPQTGSEGSLIEAVRERGIPLAIEPMLVREVHPIKDLLALVRIARFVQRGRFAIVHTHSSKAGILGRWAAWLARTPVIVHTVHGWGHHDRQHPLARGFWIGLEKLTLPITSRLIAVSSRNVEKGLRDGIGEARNYVTIRSGIELDRFGHPAIPASSTRTQWHIPPDALVVGMVTRLSAQKAPLDFVRAAGVIAALVPEARFLVIGDGPLRAQVEALAAELGIGEKLILTGLRRDVPELMAAMDIFVLSSLWEGLPRVLPQAMATGLPVVATAVDGSAEAVTHGVNGYLVPPGNWDALAQAVVELAQDPDKRSRMGRAGQERVGEFGAVKMVAEIAALYVELLEQRTHERPGAS
jgi:glycosyltransferase involved in cell wall biosynthesis